MIFTQNYQIYIKIVQINTENLGGQSISPNSFGAGQGQSFEWQILTE